MFSMAGASLFLPFLPLLPKQILLTNLMTDFPETTISSDRVDALNIEHPHCWDIRFIRRYMLTFGILSSVFDYMTFAVLLFILRADEQQFQTGWFVESVVSAALIVLVIRTRLPFSPLGTIFGFTPLPMTFYGWMLLIVIFYIVSAEITKRLFYRGLNNKD